LNLLKLGANNAYYHNFLCASTSSVLFKFAFNFFEHFVCLWISIVWVLLHNRMATLLILTRVDFNLQLIPLTFAADIKYRSTSLREQLNAFHNKKRSAFLE